MRRYTDEEFLQLNKERNPNIKIIGELPKDSETPVLCECQKCKCQFERTKRSLLHDFSNCAFCNGKKVKVGFNDMKTTHPEIAQYYIDNFALTHTVGSSIKGLASCPICGTKKMVSPSVIKRQGFGCLLCSDGVSYPNKYGRSVFSQLPVDRLEFEYSPNWIGRRYFDIYFEYKNIKCAVEMDGGLGHTYKMYHNEYKLDCVIRDSEKEVLAKENGVEVIRIDCLKSDANYIKENMIKSRISEIFDLSNIDWGLCAVMAEKNLLYEICEDYRINTEVLVKDLATKYKLSSDTVAKYLKVGHTYGLCDYSRNEIRKRRGKTLSKEYGRKVRICNSIGQEIGIYDSVKIGIMELNKLFPNKTFKLNSANDAIRVNKPYKGFSMTILLN